VLETVYTCALIAVALGVTWYSGHVVHKLYKGED
jgi:DNA mismatch repair protein MutH